jgi:plastocyanin
MVSGNRRSPWPWTSLIAVLIWAAPAHGLRAADSCNWLGEEMPLPLPVETPRDIHFKTLAERQYLIFNLLVGGKVALQRGDYATAIRKWETLLKTPDLEPQIERIVTPFLAEAREKLAQAGGKNFVFSAPDTQPIAHAEHQSPKPIDGKAPGAPQTETVTGLVSGGGQMGPGGAVVWLRRLDGPMPKIVPQKGVITQKDKTFIPHVLAVSLGSTVDFRNEDHIYHDVFSLTRPSDFDAGVRAAGFTYSRKFDRPGPVDLLCNIHATMSAFIYVVDSPFFAKTQPGGTFRIPGVPAGRYEVSVWHEASSTVAQKTIVIGPGSTGRVNLLVGGDKRPGPFVPDKYGHNRQTQLGY